jgi:hypothetical protein
MHNFKYAGALLRKSDVHALRGMWVKHLVSILDLMESLINDPTFVPTEQTMKDKFDDNINYTLLLEGLIRERQNSEEVDRCM